MKLVSQFISIPARMKQMRFGKNSFIGPGYDFLFNNLRGVEAGDNVAIGRNAWIQTLKRRGQYSKIYIGNGTNIGRHAVISSLKKIIIGKKCLISYNVSLLDHDHEYQYKNISPMDSGLTIAKEIIIGDYCFIGAHSFILKGVKLGKHCTVAANSVVTKSFPAYSVIGGNPAKLIKTIHKKKNGRK